MKLITNTWPPDGTVILKEPSSDAVVAVVVPFTVTVAPVNGSCVFASVTLPVTLVCASANCNPANEMRKNVNRNESKCLLISSLKFEVSQQSINCDKYSCS